MNQTSTPARVATKPCGCPDFNLSRRRFLGGVAAGTAAFAGASIFGDAFRQVTYGAEPAGPVLVVLSFRGGADGLSIVVPKNATDQGVITSQRGSIAVPVDRLVGGNANWGLHPALAPLIPMWDGGKFGAVHGTGLASPNRSHFDAMEQVELANPGSSTRQGWINRAIGLGSSLPEEQMQLGSSMLPTSLVGQAPALGAGQVTDLKLPDLWNDEKLTESLQKMWSGHPTSLNDGVRTALGSVGRLAALAGDEDGLEAAKARYPGGQLQDVLANTAQLIKAEVGAKMITIDYGDWDMHNGLGTNDPQPGQWMYDHLDHFANSMKAFFDDLGTVGNRVTVVTISEFGRRVEANGDHGVDHGYCNAMLALGAGVHGGDVRGSSGLNLDKLADGDVPLQHDYRSVLWDILKGRFALSDGQRSAVFPGSWSYASTGIMN